MVNQSNTPPKADKTKTDALPQEVAEAIAEIGGLDRLLNAIRPEEIKAQANLHRILSDETRLTILQAIKQCDICPCVLKVSMKISDSRLSYHLMVLEEAGLITSYKKKNWKIYKITEKGRSI
jgi:predicted transcriptional regulator